MPSRWCLVLIIYLHSQETDRDRLLTSSITVTTALCFYVLKTYTVVSLSTAVTNTEVFTGYENKNQGVAYV